MTRLTQKDVENWRDRTFRRLPERRVRGEKSALRFVNEVGFCFTLSDFGLPVPSLYGAVCGRRHPRWPKHTHHDPEIGLTWNLKDSLPAQRLTYYGKLVKSKPTLVSLDLFPAFCALVREGKGSGDYIVDYRQGRMTRAAVQILDTLNEHGAMSTPDLRRAVALHSADATPEFNRTMAELQRCLWIAKVEEVYDPDFYYRWDLLDNWLPDCLEQGRIVTRRDAVRRLVEAYLRAAGAAQPRSLEGLFGVSEPDINTALDALEKSEAIRKDQRISGLPGTWVVWRQAWSGERT